MSGQDQSLPAENTKMSGRSHEMKRPTSKMRQQMAILFAENTQMSGRSHEMSRQSGKTSGQIAWLQFTLLVKSTRSNNPGACVS